MNTKKWEYLVSSEFEIRKVIASHYFQNCDTVIDVGAFKKKLPITHNATLHTIDPLGTIKDAFHGSFGDWVDSLPYIHGHVGMALLGFDFEGDENEWNYLINFMGCVDILVVECATEFGPSTNQLNRLIMDLSSSFVREAKFVLNLPNVEVEGFPVYNLRTMVVLRKVD